MRRLLLVLCALIVALLPALAGTGQAHAGSHWQGPVAPSALVAPGGSHWQAFVPQYPLHRGLALLPGTSRQTYGDLTPYRLTATTQITVPASVDLSPWDMPVGDQSYVSSCTSWAVTYSLGGWWARKLGLSVTAFAPMYAYRQINNGVDNGGFVPDNIMADAQGMLPMGAYVPGNYDWAAAPSGTALAQAGRIRLVGGYNSYVKMAGDDYGDSGPHAATTRSEQMAAVRYPLEYALSHNGPQVLSLAVMTTFDNATPRTAYVHDDTNLNDLLGDHALLAVGYDHSGLWVQNQWGAGWGLNGLAELSWDYVLDNVSEADGITGVTEAAGVHPAPVAAVPALALTPVNDGTTAGQAAVHHGQEVVVRGVGFRPGETVSLFIDGQYRQYMTALEDGTVSTELYDHPAVGEGPHNHHFSPGVHTVLLRGALGDTAWHTLTAA